MLEIKTITDEITDFLASAPTSEQILAFRISPALDQRLHILLDGNTNESLTPDERTELEEFLRMGHFLRMLVIRTRLKLANN